MNDPIFHSKPAWLDDMILYQIYPQSFADSNADGIGDIPGIIEKLDYLQWLGVNTCWLNPCFESPFQDAGYDVSDYYKVAQRYGTNSDLKKLFIQARKRNIRILLDLVPGHTSLQHPWFLESCKPEKNKYTDYYIWTDSVWKSELPGHRLVNGYSQRDGCYLANFFYSQPALNYGFAHPDPREPWQQPVNAPGPQQVRQEIKNIIRFWLDMGAGGFRVDMALSLVKGDIGRQETIKFWQEIRTWLDAEYPDAFLASEWGVPSLAIKGGFHADFCLPFGMPGYTALFRKPFGNGPGNDPYGFSFFDSLGKGNIMEFMDEYLLHYTNTHDIGKIILPTGNHDINPRLRQGRSFADLKVIFLFIMTMPSIPCIWYGDEIGMRSLNQLKSKEGGYNRTASRTPMQWSKDRNAGFSTATAEKLYLPIDPSIDRPTVEEQKNDLDSLLVNVQKLISIRKTHKALQASSGFKLLYAKPGIYPLIFLREGEDESFIVAINPSSQFVDAQIPSLSSEIPQTIFGAEGVFTVQGDRWNIQLPGVSGGIYHAS